VRIHSKQKEKVEKVKMGETKRDLCFLTSYSGIQEAVVLAMNSISTKTNIN
jgi:hypothetical protein